MAITPEDKQVIVEMINELLEINSIEARKRAGVHVDQYRSMTLDIIERRSSFLEKHGVNSRPETPTPTQEP
jgi:hypothetical protein